MKRYGTIIRCKSCGKESVNCGYGLCGGCYQKRYAKECPEKLKESRRRAYDKFRKRYESDKEFRKKINGYNVERQRKWLSKPENRAKRNKWLREHYRKRKVKWEVKC